MSKLNQSKWALWPVGSNKWLKNVSITDSTKNA